jgi:hypothetical protein
VTALPDASHWTVPVIDHGDDGSHGSVSFHVVPIQQPSPYGPPLSLLQYGPPVSSHRSRSACTVDGGTVPTALSTVARASSKTAIAMVCDTRPVFPHCQEESAHSTLMKFQMQYDREPDTPLHFPKKRPIASLRKGVRAARIFASRVSERWICATWQ